MEKVWLAAKNGTHKAVMNKSKYQSVQDHFEKVHLIWANSCVCGLSKKRCTCDKLIEMKWKGDILLKHWKYTGWLAYEKTSCGGEKVYVYEENR